MFNGQIWLLLSLVLCATVVFGFDIRSRINGTRRRKALLWIGVLGDDSTGRSRSGGPLPKVTSPDVDGPTLVVGENDGLWLRAMAR